MTLTIQRTASHLAQIEIWPVAFFIGVSIIWPGLLPVAIIASAFFWVIRKVASGRFSIRTPGDIATGILILTIPVTILISAFPDKTIAQALRLLSGVALYYAIVNWTNNTSRLRTLILGLAAAGIFLALISPLSVEWSIAKLAFIPSSIYDRFVLLVSDTIHPNVLAGSLVLLLPIPLGMLLFAWQDLNWSERVLHGASSLIIMAVIGLTQSRGAWIGLAAVLVTLITLRWRWVGLIGFLMAVIAGIVVSYSYGTSATMEALASGTTVGDLSGRTEIWSRAIFMIQDFSYTGIGLGSFQEVVDSLYPFLQSGKSAPEHAHNLFFQIAVDVGIPGLVAWLSILLLIIAASWQIYFFGRSNKKSTFSGLGAGFLSSQVALIVHGLTDAVTWGMVRPAPLVWGIWGLTVACWMIVQMKKDLAIKS